MADQADIAQESIERRLEQAMHRVRGRYADENDGFDAGGAATECADCGDEIPARRRALLPGVETCVECQAFREGRR